MTPATEVSTQPLSSIDNSLEYPSQTLGQLELANLLRNYPIQNSSFAESQSAHIPLPPLTTSLSDSIVTEWIEEEKYIYDAPPLIRAIMLGDTYLFASTIGLSSTAAIFKLTKVGANLTKLKSLRSSSSLSPNALYEILHTTYDGHPPLVYAANFGRSHMLALLLALGANPNQSLCYGENVLMRLIAMWSRAGAMGYDSGYIGSNHRAWLLEYEKHGKALTETFSPTLSRETVAADFFVPTTGENALAPAPPQHPVARVLHQWLVAGIQQPSNRCLVSAGGGLSLPLVEVLVEFGLDVHASNSDGRGLMHYAVDRRMCELVEYLHTLGCNVNHQDAQGCSPFMLAVGKGYADMVALLLSLGADALCLSVSRDTSVVEMGVATWLRHAWEEERARQRRDGVRVREQRQVAREREEVEEERRERENIEEQAEMMDGDAAVLQSEDTLSSCPCPSSSSSSSSFSSSSSSSSSSSPLHQRYRSLVGIYGCQTPEHALDVRRRKHRYVVYEGTRKPTETPGKWPPVPFWYDSTALCDQASLADRTFIKHLLLHLSQYDIARICAEALVVARDTTPLSAEPVVEKRDVPSTSVEDECACEGVERGVERDVETRGVVPITVTSTATASAATAAATTATTTAITTTTSTTAASATTNTTNHAPPPTTTTAATTTVTADSASNGDATITTTSGLTGTVLPQSQPGMNHPGLGHIMSVCESTLRLSSTPTGRRHIIAELVALQLAATAHMRPCPDTTIPAPNDRELGKSNESSSFPHIRALKLPKLTVVKGTPPSYGESCLCDAHHIQRNGKNPQNPKIPGAVSCQRAHSVTLATLHRPTSALCDDIPAREDAVQDKDAIYATDAMQHGNALAPRPEALLMRDGLPAVGLPAGAAPAAVIVTGEVAGVAGAAGGMDVRIDARLVSGVGGDAGAAVDDLVVMDEKTRVLTEIMDASVVGKLQLLHESLVMCVDANEDIYTLMDAVCASMLAERSGKEKREGREMGEEEEKEGEDREIMVDTYIRRQSHDDNRDDHDDNYDDVSEVEQDRSLIIMAETFQEMATVMSEFSRKYSALTNSIHHPSAHTTATASTIAASANTHDDRHRDARARRGHTQPDLDPYSHTSKHKHQHKGLSRKRKNGQDVHMKREALAMQTSASARPTAVTSAIAVAPAAPRVLHTHMCDAGATTNVPHIPRVGHSPETALPTSAAPISDAPISDAPTTGTGEAMATGTGEAEAVSGGGVVASKTTRAAEVAAAAALRGATEMVDEVRDAREDDAAAGEMRHTTQHTSTSQQSIAPVSAPASEQCLGQVVPANANSTCQMPASGVCQVPASGVCKGSGSEWAIMPLVRAASRIAGLSRKHVQGACGGGRSRGGRTKRKGSTASDPVVALSHRGNDVADSTINVAEGSRTIKKKKSSPYSDSKLRDKGAKRAERAAKRALHLYERVSLRDIRPRYRLGALPPLGERHIGCTTTDPSSHGSGASTHSHAHSDALSQSASQVGEPASQSHTSTSTCSAAMQSVRTTLTSSSSNSTTPYTSSSSLLPASSSSSSSSSTSSSASSVSSEAYNLYLEQHLHQQRMYMERNKKAQEEAAANAAIKRAQDDARTNEEVLVDAATAIANTAHHQHHHQHQHQHQHQLVDVPLPAPTQRLEAAISQLTPSLLARMQQLLLHIPLDSHHYPSDSTGVEAVFSPVSLQIQLRTLLQATEACEQQLHSLQQMVAVQQYQLLAQLSDEEQAWVWTHLEEDAELMRQHESLMVQLRDLQEQQRQRQEALNDGTYPLLSPTRHTRAPTHMQAHAHAHGHAPEHTYSRPLVSVHPPTPEHAYAHIPPHHHAHAPLSSHPASQRDRSHAGAVSLLAEEIRRPPVLTEEATHTRARTGADTHANTHPPTHAHARAQVFVDPTPSHAPPAPSRLLSQAAPQPLQSQQPAQHNVSLVSQRSLSPALTKPLLGAFSRLSLPPAVVDGTSPPPQLRNRLLRLKTAQLFDINHPIWRELVRDESIANFGVPVGGVQADDEETAHTPPTTSAKDNASTPASAGVSASTSANTETSVRGGVRQSAGDGDGDGDGGMRDSEPAQGRHVVSPRSEVSPRNETMRDDAAIHATAYGRDTAGVDLPSTPTAKQTSAAASESPAVLRGFPKHLRLCLRGSGGEEGSPISPRALSPHSLPHSSVSAATATANTAATTTATATAGATATPNGGPRPSALSCSTASPAVVSPSALTLRNLRNHARKQAVDAHSITMVSPHATTSVSTRASTHAHAHAQAQAPSCTAQTDSPATASGMHVAITAGKGGSTASPQPVPAAVAPLPRLASSLLSLTRKAGPRTHSSQHMHAHTHEHEHHNSRANGAPHDSATVYAHGDAHGSFSGPRHGIFKRGRAGVQSQGVESGGAEVLVAPTPMAPNDAQTSTSLLHQHQHQHQHQHHHQHHHQPHERGHPKPRQHASAAVVRPHVSAIGEEEEDEGRRVSQLQLQVPHTPAPTRAPVPVSVPVPASAPACVSHANARMSESHGLADAYVADEDESRPVLYKNATGIDPNLATDTGTSVGAGVYRGNPLTTTLIPPTPLSDDDKAGGSADNSGNRVSNRNNRASNRDSDLADRITGHITATNTSTTPAPAITKSREHARANINTHTTTTTTSNTHATMAVPVVPVVPRAHSAPVDGPTPPGASKAWVQSGGCNSVDAALQHATMGASPLLSVFSPRESCVSYISLQNSGNGNTPVEDIPISALDTAIERYRTVAGMPTHTTLHHSVPAHEHPVVATATAPAGATSAQAAAGGVGGVLAQAAHAHPYFRAHAPPQIHHGARAHARAMPTQRLPATTQSLLSSSQRPQVTRWSPPRAYSTAHTIGGVPLPVPTALPLPYTYAQAHTHAYAPARAQRYGYTLEPEPASAAHVLAAWPTSSSMDVIDAQHGHTPMRNPLQSTQASGPARGGVLSIHEGHAVVGVGAHGTTAASMSVHGPSDDLVSADPFSALWDVFPDVLRGFSAVFELRDAYTQMHLDTHGLTAETAPEEFLQRVHSGAEQEIAAQLSVSAQIDPTYELVLRILNTAQPEMLLRLESAHLAAQQGCSIEQAYMIFLGYGAEEIEGDMLQQRAEENLFAAQHVLPLHRAVEAAYTTTREIYSQQQNSAYSAATETVVSPHRRRTTDDTHSVAPRMAKRAKREGEDAKRVVSLLSTRTYERY